MWAQGLNTLLGLWLMIAPSVLTYGQTAADNGHITGPVLIMLSVVSYWEATRNLRKVNYPVACWLLLAPWILNYESTYALLSDSATAVLVFIFSSVKGKIDNNYGGGWRSLWKKHPRHMN